MKIGINASFLRKPGTGIGQVTFNFLEKLKEFPISNFPASPARFVRATARRAGREFPNDDSVEFFIYTETEFFTKGYPENFHFRNFLPFWKRDDLVRKMLWEREVAKRAIEDNCDVFISLYQSSTSFSRYKLPACYKLPRHIMVVHDIIPKLFPEYRGNVRQAFYWKLTERGIRSADAIVAVSERTKEDLIQELGIAKETISVAYPGVSPVFEIVALESQVASVLKKYGIERGYIYHGGGLEVRKNTEGVLRAYKQLTVNSQQSTQIPPLVISGKVHARSNKLATDVEGLVQELGLQDSVKLLGFVSEEDLPALYRGAKFFLYPSLYEGFGLPVLEAMREGVPVLCSDTASLPEVAGEAALFCDPKSTESIVQGMEKLLSDKALCESIGKKGLERAKIFSWQDFTRVILQTLSK